MKCVIDLPEVVLDFFTDTFMKKIDASEQKNFSELHVKLKSAAEIFCEKNEQDKIFSRAFENESTLHMKQKNIYAYDLLIAGGREPKNKWLHTACENARAIYCADRGAAYALATQVNPTLIVGDGDSASPKIYQDAQARGTKIFAYPVEKDDTDLQLLLTKIFMPASPISTLVATGVWGGRFDHLFSNIYSLLHFKEEQHCNLVLADSEEYMILLSARESARLSLKYPENVEAVSLLPLTPKSTASIEGVKWSLKEEELTQARPYAISNLPLNQEISCTVLEGALGLYLYMEKS